MEIEEYLKGVEGLARTIHSQYHTSAEYLEGLMKNGDAAEALAAARSAYQTPDERREAEAYLELGFFRDPDPDRRVAWIGLYLDVARAVTNLDTEAQCAEYASDQPLFRSSPDVFEAIRRRSPKARLELVDERAIQRVDPGIYKVSAGFATLVPSLHWSIAEWGANSFPDVPRFVRLDHRRIHTQKPSVMYTEAAIAPASPDWLPNLSLHSRDYARYDLLAEEKATLWDYLALRVRRLEVIASRDGDEYLSMMMEELPSADHESGLMIGRCIHLDTTARKGTPIKDAKLKHLDLAINVYRGADRAMRTAQSLKDGPTVQATYRTHLYRIEDIPFVAAFDFAALFLRSRHLFAEWVADVVGICLTAAPEDP